MKTLLYVDDSADDRLLVQRACRRARVSFGLQTLESGVEAIRYLNGEGEFADREEHPLPDLILLDLKMPAMDGFQLLSWIRCNCAMRAVPVALYTGSLIAEDIAKGYAEGADYFITKPPQFGTVIDIVRAVDKCLAADPTNCEALARFSAPEEGG